jgi:hypothetical protein
MKTLPAILIIFFAFAQLAIAQNDTLIGVLHNEKNKPLKKYPVTLGKDAPRTVITNSKGLFVFPNANLEDTLSILLKNEAEPVRIPVAGYNYITVKLIKGKNFQANRNSTPDSDMLKIIDGERTRMVNSNVITREVIEKSGCQDISCLLRRLSGVTVRGDGSIVVRGGSNSINMSSDALIVLDGIPVDNSILNSLNVNDLYEISVLKDASFYGVRGANGAILIKTMK